MLRRLSPRPLVAATLGGTAARLAAERITRERGWPLAASPAEANVLVVAGQGLSSYIDEVWRQMPAPRVRVQIDTAARAEELLLAAVAELRDPDAQRLAGDSAPEASAHPDDAAVSHDHGMHAGHDMGAMAMPGGVPMAERTPDRDGLMLDSLRVPLGPILPDWPAGLIVHTRLQGDVIQDAAIEVVTSGAAAGSGFWHSTAVRRLDGCGRLLGVAGWEHAAARARVLRDGVLSGRPDQYAVDRWARRVRRSRVLRWSLTGVGVLSGPVWVGTPFAGDAWSRLSWWTEQAGALGWSDVDDSVAAPEILDAVPDLLVGCELASARLVVASLDRTWRCWPGRRWPVVEAGAWWAGLLLPVILGGFAVGSAAWDSVLVARDSGSPVRAAVVRRVSVAAGLLVQRRRRTLAADVVLWRGGIWVLGVASVLAAVVTPVGRWAVADLPVG